MYANNSNSTEPLKQILLQIPTKKKKNNNTEKSKDYENNQLHSPLIHFSIKNPCKGIIHIGGNAEEYYHVELVCKDNNEIEYAIQAYGEEAKELYKEINTFSITRPRLFQKEAKDEQQYENLMIVKKAIDCIVDYDLTNGCVLIFRKFKNICISKRKITYE